MNSTSLDLASLKVEGKAISDDDYVTVEYAFGYVMAAVSLVGVITNAINIKTFIAMRLADGVTVTLLGLAASDFGFTFCGTILGSANVIFAAEVTHNLKNLPIHPSSVFTTFSGNVGFMFYQATCLTTTFLAIARCMCVAMPFKFKDFFTRSRSIFALVAFNVIAVAFSVPILSQMGVQLKFDPSVNKTRVVLWMSPIRAAIKTVVILIQSFFINLFSSIVVGVCIVIMAKNLKRSVNFRKMSTKGSDKGVTTDKLNHGLSGKELQIIRQVIIICTVYTLSVVPVIFIAVYRSVEDDFDTGKRLHNLYFTCSNVAITLQLVNSATTFPVYYVYNTKFRSHCFSLR